MDSTTKEYVADQAVTGPAGSEPVVSVRGLVKRYGSHEAVAGIDLEVRRGEIFAFLGPNGAGKTTTVEILEGFGQRTEGALLAWVRHVSQHATWMASVCTGASIYAAAGILAGRRATTHWAFRDVLASMGVTACPGRVVFDEPFVSSAGVSAGIDLALALTGRVHGPTVAEAIQLVIEYDPQPPFDAGAPHKASNQVMRAAGTLLAAAASP